MSAAAIRLHRRLYRARAVDDAIALVAASWPGPVTRTRDGDHHVVEADGGDPAAAHVLLAEIGNGALVLTVESEDA